MVVVVVEELSAVFLTILFASADSSGLVGHSVEASPLESTRSRDVSKVSFQDRSKR